MAKVPGTEPGARRARRVAGQRRVGGQNPAAYAPPTAPSHVPPPRPDSSSSPVATPTPLQEPRPERPGWRARVAGLRSRFPERSATGPGTPTERQSIIAFVLIGLIVVSATLGGLYLQGYLHARAVASARDDALSAAKVGVPRFASYNYKTFDADVQTAEKYLTPKFRSVYDNFQQKSVRATVLKYQASVKGDLTQLGDGSSAAAVVSGGTSHVRLLVFLSQTTTNTKLAAPKVSQSRLRVDMRKVGGKWLIDQVTAF